MPKLNNQNNELGKGKGLLLKTIRAHGLVSRIELSRVVGVNRSTISQLANPLIDSGVLVEKPIKSDSFGRPPVGLSLRSNKDLFIGLNVGVSHSQIGISGFDSEFDMFEEFATPPNIEDATDVIAERVSERLRNMDAAKLRSIGITVPGPVNGRSQKLVFAPHLGWKEIDFGARLRKRLDKRYRKLRIVVENNATASAMFEARRRVLFDRELKDYIVVRSGTGIGVGIVLRGSLFQTNIEDRGFAGEFGHMTIMADGRRCVCGNLGCWEQYASAPAAVELYKEGDVESEISSTIRFKTIAERAVEGERRAQRVLEKTGEYLGIGLANTMLSVGIPNIIISGRLIYGWEHMEESVNEAISRSMAGSLEGWSVLHGEKSGASLGGAFEIAVNECLRQI